MTAAIPIGRTLRATDVPKDQRIQSCKLNERISVMYKQRRIKAIRQGLTLPVAIGHVGQIVGVNKVVELDLRIIFSTEFKHCSRSGMKHYS